MEGLQIGSVSTSPATPTSEAGFGLIIGYGFFVNAVVGAGFLSIPYAFQTGGWLLALFLQVGCILLGLLLSYMIVEITSRMSSIVYLKSQGYDLSPIGFLALFSRPKMTESLMKPEGPTPCIDGALSNVAEMAKILLGPRWSVFYIVCLSILIFGGLMAYTSIFGTSFVSNIPLGPEATCDLYDESSFSGNCRWKYMIFVVIYGVFMVYFTCVGFRKQWYMQIALTFMRFLVMILVILCCIVALGTKTRLSDGEESHHTMPELADFSQLGSILGILLFSCIYQTNIPPIAVHIKNKERNLPLILVMITATLLVFYVLLGMVVPPAYHDVNSMVTLSFRDYSAGHSYRPFWTYLIEYIVILFPALDVFSVFPIMAITLADNISVLLFKEVAKDEQSKVKFM